VQKIKSCKAREMPEPSGSRPVVIILTCTTGKFLRYLTIASFADLSARPYLIGEELVEIVSCK
jgi:hypothetical protein